MSRVVKFWWYHQMIGRSAFRMWVRLRTMADREDNQVWFGRPNRKPPGSDRDLKISIPSFPSLGKIAVSLSELGPSVCAARVSDRGDVARPIYIDIYISMVYMVQWFARRRETNLWRQSVKPSNLTANRSTDWRKVSALHRSSPIRPCAIDPLFCAFDRFHPVSNLSCRGPTRPWIGAFIQWTHRSISFISIKIHRTRFCGRILVSLTQRRRCRDHRPVCHNFVDWWPSASQFMFTGAHHSSKNCAHCSERINQLLFIWALCPESSDLCRIGFDIMRKKQHFSKCRVVSKQPVWFESSMQFKSCWVGSIFQQRVLEAPSNCASSSLDSALRFVSKIRQDQWTISHKSGKNLHESKLAIRSVL
jgi:hypothetical protein